MNREEAKSYLIGVSWSLGTIAVDDLTLKDGEKMREAIKALSQEQQSEWERDHEILKAYSDGQESVKLCKDAISIEEVLDEINRIGVKAFKTYDDYSELFDFVDSLPSVSMEKTGRWEWNQYDYNPNLGNWHCSECRSVVIECVDKNKKGGIPLYKYCPQCGAKMEVEDG